MKYAMIPINRRYNDNDERIVRRVLIGYNHKYAGKYIGCHVVEKDPYFKDKNSSHQYIFENDGFTLVSDAYDGNNNPIFGKKRPYQYDEGLLYETAVEFVAKDDQEATEMFNNRIELH